MQLWLSTRTSELDVRRRSPRTTSEAVRLAVSQLWRRTAPDPDCRS